LSEGLHQSFLSWYGTINASRDIKLARAAQSDDAGWNSGVDA
jgi:hypothetical protein